MLVALSQMSDCPSVGAFDVVSTSAKSPTFNTLPTATPPPMPLWLEQ